MGIFALHVDLQCAPLNFVIVLLKISVWGHCAPCKKCEFGKAIITYRGKKVEQGQVCPVMVKVQAIVDF